MYSDVFVQQIKMPKKREKRGKNRGDADFPDKESEQVNDDVVGEMNKKGK